MNALIALSLIAIIPPLVIIFVSKKTELLDNPTLRGFGLGIYSALIAILLLEGMESGGIVTGGLWFLLGILISITLGVLVKEFHHHHDHTEKAHRHNKASQLRLLVSDFFHNIVDGIAVVASFAVNPGFGITSLFGILGHQVIQQGGQQILLVESGVAPRKALLISFVISLSVFLGLIVTSEALETMFICVSAGIVLWKVAADVRHTEWSAKTLVGFFVGAALLAGLLLLVPHQH